MVVILPLYCASLNGAIDQAVIACSTRIARRNSAARSGRTGFIRNLLFQPAPSEHSFGVIVNDQWVVLVGGKGGIKPAGEVGVVQSNVESYKNFPNTAGQISKLTIFQFGK